MSKESAILHVAADTGFTTKRITLYKYITPVALEGLIKHGDFKLTFRDDANDPLECLPKGAKVSDKELSHIGFISLTSNPNNKAMWGNYADKFRGACVELVFDYFYTDPDKEPANKGEELALEGIEYKKMGIQVYFLQYWKDGEAEGIYVRDGDVLLKCYYSAQRSDGGVTLLDCSPLAYTKTEQYKKRMKEKERMLKQKLWRQVSTKHPDWEYEDEYRFAKRIDGSLRIVELENGEKIYLSNKITRYVTKIILGPKSNFTREQVSKDIEDNQSTSNLPKGIRVVKAEFPGSSL